MFGRSGPWMTRVGGPQPAPSKQTATNASTAERICRSGGLGGLVVARPMKGRLYPLSGSPLRVPIWATGTFEAALRLASRCPTCLPFGDALFLAVPLRAGRHVGDGARDLAGGVGEGGFAEVAGVGRLLVGVGGDPSFPAAFLRYPGEPAVGSVSLRAHAGRFWERVHIQTPQPLVSYPPNVGKKGRTRERLQPFYHPYSATCSEDRASSKSRCRPRG
jgi:hypothetical protein